jgi:hypothetical protein
VWLPPRGCAHHFSDTVIGLAEQRCKELTGFGFRAVAKDGSPGELIHSEKRLVERIRHAPMDMFAQILSERLAFTSLLLRI